MDSKQQIPVQQPSTGERRLLPVYDRILAKFMPPAFLLDDDQKVIHIFGNAHEFLRFHSGRVEENLINLLPEDMQIALNTAIQKKSSTNPGQPVLMQNIPAEVGEHHFHVDIKIEDISEPKSKKLYYLVSFIRHQHTEASENKDQKKFNSEQEPRPRVQKLEEELRSSQEALQTSIEELQTANEGLQTSNEELQASNEELQAVNTEYERKNKELEQLDQDHENLLKSIDAGILFLDSSLHIRKFNPGISKMFKLMDQDIGRPIEHIASLGLMDHEKLLRDIRESISSKRRKEDIIMTKNGDWLLLRIQPFINEKKEEEASGAVLTFTNITSLKQAHLALQKTEQRYKAATESSTDAFFWLQPVKDVQGEIIDFTFLDLNSKGEELIGCGRQEIIGNKLCTLFPSQYKDPRFLAKYKEVFESGEPLERKINIEDQSIKAEWLQQRVIKSGDGIAITASDITEEYKAQKELQEAKESAEKANKAKSDFLAVMSHELRTPLNAIIGFCDLLLDSPLNEEQQEFSQIIKESGENLLTLIGDILELSKIESGKTELEIAPVHIKHLLQQNLKSFAPMADKKNLHFGFQINENIPTLIASDSRAIRQILLNLVNNAIKYTQEGEVHVSAKPENPDSENSTLVIQVQDTGIGIEEKDMGKIFDPFSQADTTFTREFGGTGLGLAISRNLAHQLNGEIVVESTPGEGSTFTFYMPVTLPRSPEMADKGKNFATEMSESQYPTDRQLRILIAEDDPVNQKLTSTFLKMLGHDYRIASDGEEAVRLGKEENFHIVLMDLHMPKLNGGEATREILKEYTSQNAPAIIALTADAQKEVIDQSIKNGMVDYLTKPFEKGTLKEILNKWGTKTNNKKQPGPKNN